MKLATQLGVLLVLIGVMLRAVETFELSAPTTKLLAGYVGPPPDSPHGILRQAYIDTAQPRYRLTPPAWLGWISLSAGAALVVRGWLK